MNGAAKQPDERIEEVIGILVNLGYKRAIVKGWVHQMARDIPMADTEALFSAVMKNLHSKPTPIRPATAPEQSPEEAVHTLPFPPEHGWFSAMTLWAGCITVTGLSILGGPIVIRPVFHWLGDHWIAVEILAALAVAARLLVWQRVCRIVWWALFAAGILGFLLATAGFVAGAIIYVMRTSQ